MSKIVIVSNRLPVTVKKNQQGKLEYTASIGGLSTGLKTIHDHSDSMWLGWPGIPEEEISPDEKEEMIRVLSEEYKCLPVFLSREEIKQYYDGFCNKTIWPLFHYFMAKTEYDFVNWETYQSVNTKFFKELEPFAGPEDVVWVHDYQLMLLPALIKSRFRRTKVGFFLHIPFPCMELFRVLIWRKEILTGLLGADLIGFHTYDYVRNFLGCTRRLLGLDDYLNRVPYDDRYVQVNAFPMGIEYSRFFELPDNKILADPDLSDFRFTEGIKTILSIDRLDYTKGIPDRIKSFERFLKRYPGYHGKIVLNLIVAPSRTDVDSYELLLKEIKELVSEINGKFGTMNWMPIWFFYRSFSQEALTYFYRGSDVLLVTPLRDGMNLIAKEYIAARNDYGGMVVISETAGAASELGEAIIVNPNDYNSTAEGIKYALEMPSYERAARNRIMHTRLKRYNVNFWAKQFLKSLEETVRDSISMNIKMSADDNLEVISAAYRYSKKRILFLDYDGTLVGFQNIPERAKPDLELKELLCKLSQDPNNTIVIVSGRDRAVLSRWLKGLNLYILASHGLWLLDPQSGEWSMMLPLDNEWKNKVRPILELYTDSMPGSFIEEKEFSLAWHYRQCDPDMVASKLTEIRDTLSGATHSSTIGLQEGNKVLEIKDTRFNKGYGAMQFLKNGDYDFVLGIGDDNTDEDLFASLPESAYSIKIGMGNTNASYRMKSWLSTRKLLKEFAE